MEPSCTCEKCELKELFMDNLQGELLVFMCSGKIEKQYQQGEIIINQGIPITEFTYLKSGLVKLFKRGPEGKEQIISIAKPMDYVSLLSVFSDSSYNYSVTALEDSVTCNLSLDDIKKTVRQNGELALGLLTKMSRLADSIILDTLEIRKKHLRGRVAHILLYFSEEVYYNKEFDLPLSRKEIAEYVGMTTENVIRTLSEFKKDGILKIYGKTLVIENRETLHKISEYG